MIAACVISLLAVSRQPCSAESQLPRVFYECNINGVRTNGELSLSETQSSPDSSHFYYSGTSLSVIKTPRDVERQFLIGVTLRYPKVYFRRQPLQGDLCEVYFDSWTLASNSENDRAQAAFGGDGCPVILRNGEWFGLRTHESPRLAWDTTSSSEVCFVQAVAQNTRKIRK
jgi:hypothetical protein